MPFYCSSGLISAVDSICSDFINDIINDFSDFDIIDLYSDIYESFVSDSYQ